VRRQSDERTVENRKIVKADAEIVKNLWDERERRDDLRIVEELLKRVDALLLEHALQLLAFFCRRQQIESRFETRDTVATQSSAEAPKRTRANIVASMSAQHLDLSNGLKETVARRIVRVNNEVEVQGVYVKA
jgi:hypothetical protein